MVMSLCHVQFCLLVFLVHLFVHSASSCARQPTGSKFLSLVFLSAPFQFFLPLPLKGAHVSAYKKPTCHTEICVISCLPKLVRRGLSWLPDFVLWYMTYCKSNNYSACANCGSYKNVKANECVCVCFWVCMWVTIIPTAAGTGQSSQMLRRWKSENTSYQSVQVNLQIIHLTLFLSLSESLQSLSAFVPLVSEFVFLHLVLSSYPVIIIIIYSFNIVICLSFFLLCFLTLAPFLSLLVSRCTFNHCHSVSVNHQRKSLLFPGFLVNLSCLCVHSREGEWKTK